MLLQKFKQVFSENKFQIVVRHTFDETFDSFVVDYAEFDSEKSNIHKLLDLYEEKAVVENVHFNCGIGLISIWVKVK